jgi:phosphatidylinositol alpha-1,6-mannosyltransferase
MFGHYGCIFAKNLSSLKTSMNPNFTLITHDYPPEHGGVARYLSSLVKAANGQIEVLVPLKHTTSFEKGGNEGEIKPVKFWWNFWPHWLPLIKRCLEVPHTNSILVSHIFPIGTAAWIANALGGSEYVIIFHGTDLKRAHTRWKRWLLRRICNNAELLIVNSDATQRILQKLVPTASPIKLTPAIEYFNLPEKTLTRDKLNIEENTKVILTVSRLVERKGIDTLIQAVANLSASYELVIIGDGEYAEPLHNLAELSNINVRWISDADDEKLHDWYAASDIFCLPGRETANDVEGFGIVFLEAAYAGLPVIAGESGGASEAVIHNETGLLIPPTVEACTEALIKLIEDDELAEKLGTAGHDRVVTDFDWETRWNQLRNIEHGTLNIDLNKPSSKSNRYESKALSVSVIIPCFNHAKELGNTLDSLVKQTVSVKEVIVIDDFSDDDPAETVKQFEARLPIKLIRNDENKGATVTRNKGGKMALGEFVIFLDADIVLEPEALEKMHQALVDNSRASFTYTDFYWGNVHFKGQQFSLKSLQKLNYIHTSSLIRKSDMVEFDETLKKFQDWDIWLTMAEKGKTGVWIPRDTL